MPDRPDKSPSALNRAAIYLLVFAAGSAALSWEVVWQLKASLSLGVSALGTAITLAATMGGMTAGALLAGRLLRGREVRRPLLLYGLLELGIGLSGQFLLPGFDALEILDASVYAASPGLAPLIHVSGIVLLLGLPTMAMGATIPVFGLVARKHQASLAALYGTNTAGATAGVLVIVLVWLPALGVTMTVQALTAINVLVCLAAWLLSRRAGEHPEVVADAGPQRPGPALSDRAALLIAATTGFVTFALEVAWFRALRAAFRSTSLSFAIMLASVLGPLALGAHLVPVLRRKGVRLSHLLGAAGVAALVATPFIERFDAFSLLGQSVWEALPVWILVSLAALGLPMLLTGTALPWLLESRASPRAWARLYAINTLGAVAGSLATAWILLPGLGFARTSWLAALLLVAAALIIASRRGRVVTAALGIAALVAAVATESGIGDRRIIGRLMHEDYSVLAHREGPDSTVAVLGVEGGARTLTIDGFEAASDHIGYDYMTWMGRLPVILHPDPKDALVICFGTGRTAGAIRQEAPVFLDVVDINPAVIDAAPWFLRANKGVLDHWRTRTVVMDGRAWLRRSDRHYDVITLEPMPPNFTGGNSLYSLEFYEWMGRRLRPGGVAAQWLPLHLVHPRHGASIAATFREVFPDAILWVHPESFQAVLLGRNGSFARPLGADWPGLAREAEDRTLLPAQIRDAVDLDAGALGRYAALGQVITDDNQLLSYGLDQWSLKKRRQTFRFNLSLLAKARDGLPLP